MYSNSIAFMFKWGKIPPDVMFKKMCKAQMKREDLVSSIQKY